MQAKVTHGVQFGLTWPDNLCSGERRKPPIFMCVAGKVSAKHRSSPPLKSSFRNSAVSTSSGINYFQISSPETHLQKVKLHLNNRCLYLVGLMGSGKTTVGKEISNALEYSFIDCDALIEQSMEGSSVAEIFQTYGEAFFRDRETQALKKLSAMRGFVVSTGGGAVIRPINWRYMRSGVTVWLDVPLETLARRIASDGTESRPLLHLEGVDPYEQALRRLVKLWEERSECYGNADARVSVERIALKLGYDEVSDVTPADIAREAIEQVDDYLEKEAKRYE